MKNAMKKFFSIALALVLLVSVFPMNAAAETNGIDCTKSPDCQHVGDQHIAGCPIIPCTNSDTCNHGGWNHAATCPKASTGCNLSADCTAEFHAAGCKSQIEEVVCSISHSCAAEEHDSDCPKSCNLTKDCPHTSVYHSSLCPRTCTGQVDCPHTGNSHNAACLSLNPVEEPEEEPEEEPQPEVIVKIQCSTCGATYNEGTTHNCPEAKVICSQCGKAYKKGTEHECAILTCGACGEKYQDGSNHKCPIKFNTHKVYLHVFKDNKIDEEYKSYIITDSLAQDDIVSLSEVKTFVNDRFNAVNTDKGIQFDGLYMSTGDFAADFVKYGTSQPRFFIEDDREEDHVHIYVMITNAKLEGSTGTADSSNPKTGDNIQIAVTTMTASAAALALFFFFNKKRAAI